MNNILQSLRNHPWRIIAVLLLLVGCFFGYRQLTGYQKLTIDFKNITDSGAAKIYAVADKPKESPENLINNLKPVREVSQTTTIKLRKGHYVIVAGDVPDYNRQYEQITLNNEPATVIINPSYSKARLTAMLVKELPAIQAAITSSVPGIGSSYLLGPGVLYGKGEWYGTVIYPNLSAEERRIQYVDVYRVVVKKSNGTWKVATMPPEIVLSAVTYPGIPRQVLIDTNNQNQP